MAAARSAAPNTALGFLDRLYCIGVDAAVYFYDGFRVADGIEQRPGFTDFIQRIRNEFLAAETGIDAHDEDHIELRRHAG